MYPSSAERFKVRLATSLSLDSPLNHLLLKLFWSCKMSQTTLAAKYDIAPPLTAKQAPWMQQVLQAPNKIHEWIRSFGSPLHIVNGAEFRRNVHDMVRPLQERGVSGGLYFARTANKLPWFLSLSREEGIGVTTSSLQELEETLAHGVPPQQIIVSAPGKDETIVARSIDNGCLLVIDNEDELQLVKAVATAQGKTARIGLRFSGFTAHGKRIFSRFGFPIQHSASIISSVVLSKWLQLECLHAHLDRYDTLERAAAARHLIELADYCAIIGAKIDSLNLGGGVLVRYLEDPMQWGNFVDALMGSVKGERSCFTYCQDGLGFYRNGTELAGAADLYPAWNSSSKERFIAAILDHEENNSPLHKEISDRGLKLYFEPGRALLDNTGMTAASVVFRKRDTDENLLLGLSMNKTNVSPYRSEFCSDPVFLPKGVTRASLGEGAYLVGCRATEDDLIFRRKLELPFLPEPGDSVVFLNTAGYLAHHMEIGTHGGSLPRNALYDSNSGRIVDVFPQRRELP